MSSIASMFTPLEDIKLETIDFKWISETTKLSHLKRAIRLIELDGDVYKELKDACYQRMAELDPSQKRAVVNNQMSVQDKETISKQLEDWESLLGNMKKVQHQIFSRGETQKEEQIDPETYFNQDPSKTNVKKQAENERNKGNEAIKSKDYQQAVKYYTNSLKYDPSMYQSYGNRALVFIKTKQFTKALDDCNQALKLNPNYVKAYHRKAKALIGLKNKVDAYKALQEALKIEPQNSECLSELKDIREQMNEEEKGKLEGASKFKKIVIEQDSEEDEEIMEK